MPDPYKTLWWNMHQKTTDKFNTGNSQRFPLTFVIVIFYRKSNGFLIHADDTVITDCNPVGIFSKIINHRLCSVESFLAIRAPFLIITGINEFFESIMVTILLCTSVKFQLVCSPELF